jgi:hypothetical protein
MRRSDSMMGEDDERCKAAVGVQDSNDQQADGAAAPAGGDECHPRPIPDSAPGPSAPPAARSTKDLGAHVAKRTVAVHTGYVGTEFKGTHTFL